MPTAPAPDSTSANNNPTGQQPLLYPNGYAGNYSGIYPGMPATPPVSPNGFQMPNADYGTMTHQLIEHMPGDNDLMGRLKGQVSRIPQNLVRFIPPRI